MLFSANQLQMLIMSSLWSFKVKIASYHSVFKQLFLVVCGVDLIKNEWNAKIKVL